MTREEAIKYLINPVATSTAIGEEKLKEFEAYNMAIEALSADAEPTVIRSRTLMPTKDFKEWAKRVRETNPNAVVIPCDAEVVSAEPTVINETSTDLISREDAIEAVASVDETNGTVKVFSGLEIIDILNALPSADRPSGEWIIRENGNKECSLCGHERQDGWDCFCGYCGARMKGEK